MRHGCAPRGGQERAPASARAGSRTARPPLRVVGGAGELGAPVDREPTVATDTAGSSGVQGSASRVEMLLFSTLDRDEARLKWIALGVAILLHLLALTLHFPAFRREALAPRPAGTVIIVRKYVPPPPPLERRTAPIEKEIKRRMPIPDPTPDVPEPIRELEPEIQPEPFPDDAIFLLGVPQPNPPMQGDGGPADEPLLAGVGDVTSPVLIPETKVTPEYPEAARVGRLEGKVILRAVIRRDGTVGDVSVLRVSMPSLGFEESAMAAVRQWRYQPAMQRGRPVDVYFTVMVDFELR